MTVRCVLLALLAALASGGAAAGQTTRPTTRPATRPAPAAFDDRWLGPVCLDELTRAVAGEKLDELARRMESALLARLACGRLKNLAPLTDAVYVLNACRYLRAARRVERGGELAGWLIRHRELSRRLFRALGDVRSPQKALERLRKLVDAEEKAVLDHPELAVAFATAEPLKHYRDQPDPASLEDSFRYYAKARVPFRYDLRKMPYELSRYLASSRLSLPERRWAVGQYARQRNPARAYFDVKYDDEHYDKGVPKKIADLPYTLPNLRKVGGVCIEQAYYAAEVCKALGVPAAIVSGRGKSGISHAWMACLNVARGGREAYWDSQTGRYQAHQYFTGEVLDPAKGRRIPEGEVMLAGFAAQLPLRRREEARAALTLARLADRRRDDTPTPDVAELKRLAELYDERFAGAARLKAPAGWIQPGTLDQAVVEELLDAAIARNLALREAWEFIVELRKSDRLPVEHLGRFFDTLVTKTARTYPDYSCVLVMRIVPTMPDAKQRQDVYRRALGVYAARSDLCGRIHMAFGDDLKQRGETEQALRQYERAALRCVDIAEIVLDASARGEALLVAANRRDLAIRMYANLFRRAKKRRTAFRDETAHYQLGQRLSQLLHDAGDHAAAKRVESQL